MKALLVLVLFGAAAAHAQMYKCVDERGVTQYSDKPRPGCKGGPVDIRPIPPISGSLNERSEDFARDDADFNRRQNERERAAAKERAELRARCSALRQEQARLSSGRRLAQVNDKGERVYLPDEVRDQRLAQVRDALRGCP
ncbi:MAG: DUF4124 domain-containing protein [Betaproteobacteria bacterium]|nr:MAG: DUF4124 domain-containing protein [Betaproteobacteria bacterium]